MAFLALNALGVLELQKHFDILRFTQTVWLCPDFEAAQ